MKMTKEAEKTFDLALDLHKAMTSDSVVPFKPEDLEGSAKNQKCSRKKGRKKIMKKTSELEKSRAGLVKKKVQVKGKSKTFFAFRLVRAGAEGEKIGQTRSGKPVFKNKLASSYKNFDSTDHGDAALLHKKHDLKNWEANKKISKKAREIAALKSGDQQADHLHFFAKNRIKAIENYKGKDPVMNHAKELHERMQEQGLHLVDGYAPKKTVGNLITAKHKMSEKTAKKIVKPEARGMSQKKGK